ncbi:RNase H domain-containing protein [Trichonephila clavipes]|nr:RNase H domain-containing protein [Trichonephila clavipes]
MQLGSTSAIRCLERGCPQGSVPGPIFWNIFINDLLFKSNNLDCCKIIAFADDILVCSQERNAINIIQFSDKSTDDFSVIGYTDGSKIDGRVVFAFVVFKSGVESENFQFRIRDECTVFVAELLCLNFAIKWITEQNSVILEYVICTDSLSTLDSLKCISSSNNIIVEIQKQLKSLRDKNISTDFAFVRGHTGILVNE